MDQRIISLEIMVNTIEREIKNKNRSSRREKALIKARLEEPVKLEYIAYQPESYDEWVIKTQLHKVKKELEEINQLRKNILSIEDRKKKKKKEVGIKLNDDRFKEKETSNTDSQ